MAFAATTEWDVRTTGSDTNGGGFNTAATGTDRSQQDAAFISFTDLVIGGTNTTITSAAHPFDATSPGNIINITGGTGFTVQRVQIVSVAGAVATCDKAVGTAASTGGTGNLGGAMLTLAATAALVAGANTVHVKAGTYTLTASVTTVFADQSWIGYQTTHRDGGTRPLITTATSSTDIFRIAGAGYYFSNINCSNTAAVKAGGINGWNTFCTLVVENCKFDGHTYGIGTTNNAYNHVSVFACEIANYTGNAISTAGGSGGTIEGCYIHGGTNAGLAFGVAGAASVTRCIFYNNAGSGIQGNASSICLFANNIFHSNGSGFNSTGSVYADFHNNIFWNNVNGIFVQAGNTVGSQHNNAFGGNTNNRVGSNFGGIGGDITITADPCTNAAAGDFSLNSTAGGGALCKGAGYQWH